MVLAGIVELGGDKLNLVVRIKRKCEDFWEEWW